MFDQLARPIKIEEIKNEKLYYKELHGSQLTLLIFDKEVSMLLEGVGVSFGHDFQITPYQPVGKKHQKLNYGAMNAGRINVRAAYSIGLNDILPTHKNIVSLDSLTAMVQVAEHEDDRISGMILNVFENVKFQSDNVSWEGTNIVMRNFTLQYETMQKGIEWAKTSPTAKYLATPGNEMIINGTKPEFSSLQSN